MLFLFLKYADLDSDLFGSRFEALLITYFLLLEFKDCLLVKSYIWIMDPDFMLIILNIDEDEWRNEVNAVRVSEYTNASIWKMD